MTNRNIGTPAKWPSTDLRQIQLTNKVVDLISVDLLPLSLVDSPQFRSLLATAQPSFTMPSRKHLSTKLLPDRALKVKSALKLLLLQCPAVCLTVDLWSS